MRAVAIVPARGGSERIPRKNLALLQGRTLIRRALETAVAGPFTQIVLSSDDEEILGEANGLAVTCVRRPSALASSTATSYAVVLHALQEVESEAERYEAVAVIQATSPFTTAGDLAGALELLDRSGSMSVVSVSRVQSALHPLKLKRLEPDGRLHPYLADDALAPSHALPPLWTRNGSIYLSRRAALDAGALIDESDVRGYEMPAERSYDIDTPRDLAFVRFLCDQSADPP